jgi:hypothetical protein
MGAGQRYNCCASHVRLVGLDRWMSVFSPVFQSQKFGTPHREWTVFAFDRFCSLLSGESGGFEEFRGQCRSNTLQFQGNTEKMLQKPVGTGLAH